MAIKNHDVGMGCTGSRQIDFSLLHRERRPEGPYNCSIRHARTVIRSAGEGRHWRHEMKKEIHCAGVQVETQGF